MKSLASMNTRTMNAKIIFDFIVKLVYIYQLLEVQQLPSDLMCYDATKLDGIEALYIFDALCLHFTDLDATFRRPIPHYNKVVHYNKRSNEHFVPAMGTFVI